MKRISIWTTRALALAAITFLPVWADDLPAPKPAKPGKWVKMFDGKTLNGWKPTERAENWAVEDGMITGKGERSHLFWTVHECENCEYKATIKLAPKSNSGMYFRAKFMTGWPNGYEAQLNCTHTDWKRTGSLYNFSNIKEQLCQDNEWFTQHVIVEGNHVIIKVNDKTVVDYVDEKNTHAKGYLALQQHDPGSRVWAKDLMYRALPAKKK